MKSKYAKLCTFWIADKKLRRSIRNTLCDKGYAIPDTEPDVKAFTKNRAPYGKRKVAILTNRLLDWKTRESCHGGGERYALNMARLLKNFNFEVHFYQVAFEKFSGEYYGFPVYTIPIQEGYGEFAYNTGNIFYDLTKDYDHVYYNMPEYSSGKMRSDAIMTCHGIWFDHDNYENSNFRQNKWFKHLGKVFSQPKKIVSVDSNSINVIRTFWPKLTNNMSFIPNFVDLEMFKPDFTKRNNEKLRIIFPRRSQINRGSRILGDILSEIPYDVEFYWIGDDDVCDSKIIKKVAQKDKRLTFESASFDDMPNWYQKCDIAVIPTIACEGTSLSAAEALACGCSVVTTHIGGLTDLVMNGYNGIVCDPNPYEIAQAINTLIKDKELRETYQQKAIESSKLFSLENWKKKWAKVLLEQDWISPQQAADAKYINENEIEKFKKNEIAILTRNAIHGGVESLIKQEAEFLNADVIVCGGHDFKETTPFKYSRADNKTTLLHKLTNYSKILYHWIPDYAIEALKESKKPCVEFVHRTDVNNCDKPIANSFVSHSQFLADYTKSKTGKKCEVVPHPIDASLFVPAQNLGNYIGGVTSYYKIKGLDIFIKAWASIKDEFPNIKARFYGQGSDLDYFKKLSEKLGVDVEFLPATAHSENVLKEFRCFVSPSRIEGMPVAILEAMAMNIPVIASDLDGMKEFIKTADARGYSDIMTLIQKESPNDLAKAIRAILREIPVKNTREYIQKYFNPKTHIDVLKKSMDLE